MAIFFNALGGVTVTGTSTKDIFYAFMRDTNFAESFPDAVLASLVWATGITRADGSKYEVQATNIQVSQDLLAGGDGTDIVYGSNFNDALFYNNGGFGSGFGSFSAIEQFYLGAGDDIIDFTAHGPGGVDYLKNVKVSGDEGNDIIIGGGGNDSLDGGSGDDVIFGYRKADTITGGGGNDILYGDDLGFDAAAGDDTLLGGAGSDTLYGGGRGDRLEGGDDNDFLYGGLGDDNLLGGAGDDILQGDDPGTSGNDKLDGDSGNDQLYGGGGIDTLGGGAGNDLLDGGTGDDVVTGGTGNDSLVASGANDRLDGGLDSDTVIFSGARSDYAFSLSAGVYTFTDLRAGSPDGTDTVLNVEFFQFSDGVIEPGGVNNPPTITSDGGGDTAALSLVENSQTVTTVSASDVDAGQVMSYAIGGGADAAKFAIDAATGLLTFTQAPDFENPGDSDGNNVYEVVVRASDGLGGSDTQTLAITVQDVVDGQPPVITSNGGGATAAVSIAENSTVVTAVAATDPDGTVPTYAISGGADAALFTINATTGALAFAAAPDFEHPGDANGDGAYQVVVSATDGTNNDSQALTVTVTNVNDNAPIITSSGGGASGTASAAENNTVVLTVAASDADGTAPLFSISGGADAGKFKIDAATGALAFLVAPDFEAPTDSGGNNVYDVVVTASDGTFSDSQALAIAVANANDNLPVITSNGGGATAAISMAENAVAVTTVAATDADGSAPAYAISGGADAALFQIDAASGALVFATAPDFEAPADADGNGTYEVIVSAGDGVNADSQALSVTVTDVNELGKTITGTTANDVITPTASVTAFRTTAQDDTIFALAGNDTIDGGAGADRMEGGAGNDVYYVDSWSDDGKSSNDDLVVEAASSGVDLVNSSVSYRLATDVENLTLLGTAALSGTGNDLANVINGNAGANILSGEGGNDTMAGGLGDDILLGGAGSDKLDGGGGVDRLEGGADDDTYTVDTFSNDGISTNDDLVVELAGGGTADLVNASVSYILPGEVERLKLTGTDPINGTGNALDNTLTGNAGANMLSGGAGSDALFGNAGDDLLLGGDGMDRLEGGADADRLEGGAANDTMTGQAGNDLLIGGTGKDTLTGGLDADTFQFAFGDTGVSSASFDTITDFVTGQDLIDLSSVTGGLPVSAYAEGTIASNLFADALTAARAMAIGGVSTVFVAGTTDGYLFWDGNGDGTLDQSVMLKGLNALDSLSNADII